MLLHFVYKIKYLKPLTIADIQRMLAENQKRMGDMQMSWEQRLEAARYSISTCI